MLYTVRMWTSERVEGRISSSAAIRGWSCGPDFVTQQFQSNSFFTQPLARPNRLIMASYQVIGAVYRLLLYIVFQFFLRGHNNLAIWETVFSTKASSPLLMCRTKVKLPRPGWAILACKVEICLKIQTSIITLNREDEENDTHLSDTLWVKAYILVLLPDGVGDSLLNPVRDNY